jgi:hypothetical protein
MTVYFFRYFRFFFSFIFVPVTTATPGLENRDYGRGDPLR